jgi:hypothetical protein
MIIGLSGYAGSGKDEIAKILVNEYEFTRVAFADAVRNLLYEVNPVVNELASDIKHAVNHRGWDEIKKVPAVRVLLQNTGLGVRQLFGDEFWIKEALMQTNKEGNYVFTDVRFENEANAIRDINGHLWRVKRPGVEAVNSHISEKDLDGYKFDQILSNEGTLEDLTTKVRNRMELALNAN